MCGVAGVFGQPDEPTVRRMLARLRHRGPDDERLVSGKGFCLGARRLAIMDPAGGRQPIANQRQDVWGALNGEIYNFPELRGALAEQGRKLLTRCDTEVLPHLYEEQGRRLPEKLDGMFALAVWDDAQGHGLLARDRLGKKPLYFHRRGDVIYFASEIKALLEVPGFERRIRRSALTDYLSLKNVPCPASIFEGIEQLPPAHRLVFRVGEPAKIERYWSIDEAGVDPPRDEVEARERVLELLRRSVRKRLHADVPIGFFLSGGLDSSLIACLAAEEVGEPREAFTLVYSETSTTPGKETDRYWAARTAERLGMRRHEAVLDARDLPAALRRIVRAFDEPFAGVASTYFLAQLISQQCKTALSGDGADELFGSYLSHRLAAPLARYPEFVRTGDRSLLDSFADEVNFVRELYEPDDWSWRSKLSVFSEAEKRSLLTDPQPIQPIREYWREQFQRIHAADPLHRVLLAELNSQLPDQVLCFVDRLSMAHSLEIRCPFLDAELAGCVAALPGEWKIRQGTAKRLLKDVARRFLPNEQIDRPKEGFVLPIANWLGTTLREFTRETLAPSRLARHGLFHAACVLDWIEKLERNPSDYRIANRVYALLMFQLWHEEYMICDARSSEAP